MIGPAHAAPAAQPAALRWATAWRRFDRTAADAGSQPLRLADGSRVEIRPLRPLDATAEQRLIDDLSQASRYQRFHFGLPRLTPQLLRQLVADIDQQRHVALAAWTRAAAGSQTLVGDAHCVRSDDDARAEFALTIADAWQGRGLGRALLERLRRDAARRGIATLVGDVLWEQQAMLALARSAGATLRRHPGDATLVRVELAT